MEQRPQSSTWPPVRRKKKLPKWQRTLRRYWPPIRFGLIIVALIAVIWLSISGIVSLFRSDSTDPADQSAGKPIHGETLESVDTTPPAETTLSQEEMVLEAKNVIAEADLVAAGYDYNKAIRLLQESACYDSVPEMAAKVEEYRQRDSELVSYPNMNTITHIFFHSLIVDPSRAFDGEYTDDGYNLYMTTVDEFKAMLEEMYARGYILITPYQQAHEVTDETGTHFVYGDIRIPEGKTPFIMSQDDLNYYGYMIAGQDGTGDKPIYATTAGDGFAHRIVVGEDGYPTCEYMDENGNVTTGDYDLVPILERFIQEHPDFAYQGARAVLGMTGYEGVFGYRTNPNYKPAMGEEAFNKECEEAKKVAQCLRDHGWVLASHSYGHPAYGNISSERVDIDSQKWENTVQPIIGNCDVILYPHGSDIAGIEMYTFDNAKFSHLYEDGYRYFFNVDSHISWCQLGSKYFRGGRRNLDGYRMYHDPEMLDDLFDVANVFDKARPTPVPNI